MAQKTKAAAQQSRSLKANGAKQGKASNVKKTTGGKATAVIATKAEAKAKPAKAVVLNAKPTSKPAVAKGAKAAKPEKQIEQAKAALKKETAAQATAPAKPESKARARKISIDINPNEAASALVQKWAALYKKAEQIEAKPYNMKNVFEEKTAITHKVLGWGYILANRNDRLEVLFKDGIKYLISNYKP
ncbi:MAG: hypothetical protein KF799_07240 [Bdellovibrionales bacterium]|nr:hypothetical protein [Bdellovibrionales bacterium]